MIVAMDDHAHGRWTIDGHAGAGAYGQDIVCAGASAIVETAICLVRGIPDVDVRREAGHVEICARTRRARRRARSAFAGLDAGFRLLEEAYPQIVRVDRAKSDLHDRCGIV